MDPTFRFLARSASGARKPATPIAGRYGASSELRLQIDEMGIDELAMAIRRQARLPRVRRVLREPDDRAAAPSHLLNRVHQRRQQVRILERHRMLQDDERGTAEKSP